MKRKNLLLLTVLAFLVLFISCGGTGNKGKKFYGITRNYIGIQKGNTIKFYENQGHNVWQYNEYKDFKLPDDVKSLYITETKIAILNSQGKLLSYRNIAPKLWEIENKETMSVPKEYERVFEFGGLSYGFIKQDTVDVYYNGKIYPEGRFVVPKDTKEFFNAGGEGVIVTQEKSLDLYQLENGKWQSDPVHHFEFPSDAKEILPVMYYPGFAIIKEKSIDFYAIGFDRPPGRFTTFIIPE